MSSHSGNDAWQEQDAQSILQAVRTLNEQLNNAAHKLLSPQSSQIKLIRAELINLRGSLDLVLNLEPQVASSGVVHIGNTSRSQAYDNYNVSSIADPDQTPAFQICPDPDYLPPTLPPLTADLLPPLLISSNIDPNETQSHQPEPERISAELSFVLEEGEATLSNTATLEQPPHEPLSKLQYDQQGGVLRLHPDVEQWKDFDGLLRFARAHGASQVGVCRIKIPQGALGRELPTSTPPVEPRGHSFTAFSQKNGTFYVNRKRSHKNVASNPTSALSLSTSEPTAYFESLLSQQDGLTNVRYSVDLDAGVERDRSRLGLPIISPISNLRGDRLAQTRRRVPGLHFAYSYKAGPYFGAPFAMHVEDWNLLSVNYLYTGRKTVLVVAPEYEIVLKRKSLETNAAFYKGDCSQVLRHSPTYYPAAILQRWDIPYVTFEQEPFEAFVIFPNAPHQGFSHGHTVAEAINYADVSWNLDNYIECVTGVCPEPRILKWMMEAKAPGEKQFTEDDTEMPKSRSRKEDGATNKKRRRAHEDLIPKNIGVTQKKAKKIGAKKVADSHYLKPDALVTEEIKLVRAITRIPKNCIEPLDLYRKLQKLGIVDHVKTILLTRLFFAIGSVDALLQLRSICHILRQQNPQVKHNSSDMQVLDRLELDTAQTSLLRRYYLTRLCERRQLLEKQRLNERPFRTVRLSKYSIQDTGRSISVARRMGGDGRASTRALDILIQQDYSGSSDGDESNEHRRSVLQNRLGSGRNWHAMKTRLSLASLAWVPIGGEYRISTSEVERLSKRHFEVFLDVLVEQRGTFLSTLFQKSEDIYDVLSRRDLSRIYSFESASLHDIQQESVDSQNLIDFCHSDP